MIERWQDLEPDVLERAYNPRVAVPDAQFQIDEMGRLSSTARAAMATDPAIEIDENIRYGDGPLETLDFYRPVRRDDALVPLVVFIHGGYWRALDKHDHSFVVPPLIAAGAGVANVNYDLCPAITLDVMVEEVVRAVRYCHQQARTWQADPTRLVLIGHSAGAHLAARVLNQPADEAGLAADLVAAMVGISGIYEPEIATRLNVNAQAQIHPDVARRNDCLNRRPGGSAAITVWAGGDEPAGWIEQTAAYARLVRAGGVSCDDFTLEGTNHFTVLQRSMAPDTRAFETIRRMLAG